MHGRSCYQERKPLWLSRKGVALLTHLRRDASSNPGADALDVRFVAVIYKARSPENSYVPGCLRPQRYPTGGWGWPWGHLFAVALDILILTSQMLYKFPSSGSHHNRRLARGRHSPLHVHCANHHGLPTFIKKAGTSKWHY